MKNVIILLSIFLFLFVAGVSIAGNSKTPAKDAQYTLYYNSEGEIVSVKPTDQSCKIRAQGSEVNNELIKQLLTEHPYFKVPQKDVMIFYGSPDCIIYLGGTPICWCCR